MYYIVSNELYHHGVKGMKWGVRRYRNYDGSYTQKGVQIFDQSLEQYNNAKKTRDRVKDLYKQSKKYGSTNVNGQEVNVQKSVLKEANSNLKAAKKQLNKDYNQLRKDKAGDKGKELYRSGKTITGNQQKLQYAGLIAAGTAAASSWLAKNGKQDLAKYTAIAGVGLEAVNGIFAAKNAVEAHYLRAYYGHSRN